jgi:hypothetical protein
MYWFWKSLICSECSNIPNRSCCSMVQIYHRKICNTTCCEMPTACPLGIVESNI